MRMNRANVRLAWMDSFDEGLRDGSGYHFAFELVTVKRFDCVGCKLPYYTDCDC